MSRSLSSKLITSAVATLFCVSAAALLTVVAVFHWDPPFFLNRELAKSADRIADGLQFAPDGRFKEVVLSPGRRVVYDALRSDAIYRVLDRHGAVLAASDGVMTPLTAAVADAAGLNGLTMPDRDATFFIIHGAGVALHVLTTKVLRDGSPVYIQVGRSERLHRAMMDNDGSSFIWATSIAVLIAMLVFSAVVWRTFCRALRPLRYVSEAAMGIGSANLHSRLSTEKLPQELLPLIDAFNNALGRLEVGYRAQQTFLATVAHELKTPLALIRGEIELGGGTGRQLVLKDIDRMARQVHQLLHLAEVSDRNNFLFEQVDVGAVADDAIEHLTRLAERMGVAIDLVQEAPPGPKRADGAALFVLIKNLLENALHHAPAGSRIVVNLDRNTLRIRDWGTGISEADAPFIFKRFWRGPGRRDSGAGLGLAICSEIVRAHQWQLTVAHDRSPGVEFKVSFESA